MREDLSSQTLAPLATDQLTIHPLDPLAASEVVQTTRILQPHGGLSPRVRFISTTLHEPPKELVRAFKPGDAFPREAEVVLTDHLLADQQASTFREL